jgi:hypothetical protein
MVFQLILISRQRGLEGCIIFLNDNDSSDYDKYIQKVIEYKYYLEQYPQALIVNNLYVMK